MGLTPKLKLGYWIVLREDGIWYMNEPQFRTKRDAIFEVSSATLDPRPTPKVVRIQEGVYDYTPRDVDSTGWKSVHGIIKLTELNITYYQGLLHDQWNLDSYEDEED